MKIVEWFWKPFKWIWNVIMNRSVRHKEIALEFKREENKKEELSIKRDNSKHGMALAIADRKNILLSCKDCTQKYNEDLEITVEKAQKIGTAQEQADRGERFINAGPQERINQLINGNIIHACEKHKYLLTEIIALTEMK